MDFRILGPLEVWHEGRPVRIGGAKERALLAFLLLHAAEPVSADRLVDALWGESPPATARKSLQVRVAGLRRALRDDLLVTHGGGYLLRLEPNQLDLHRFEHLLSDATSRLSTGDPRTALSTLEEALSLWRGPPLADFTYESFAQTAIARLEELRLSAVELRLDAQLALGGHAAAIAELEELVAAHPFRERLRAQLMLALYRDGRQGEALDVFGRTREELVDALGIEPSPMLQKVQQAILRQDASLDGPLPQPERSILVAPQDPDRLAELIAIAEQLVRRPRRELILVRLVATGEELTPAVTLLNEHRDGLVARDVPARAIAFTSAAPGRDLVRIAAEQDVDLVLVDGPPDLGEPLLRMLLAQAPSDVAVYVGRDEPQQRDGHVLVLFAAGDHDWSAVELGAWLAGARGATLRLAGPAEGGERDASRALASASLAVQRGLGIAAEPLLLAPAPREVLAATEDAAVVVVGLPDRSRDDLGPVRAALASEARPPVLFVRRGLRPGGLAPRESLTRFTWTLGPPS